MILENVERSLHQVTFPPQAWTFLHLCFTRILINTLSMISTLMFPLKSIQIPLSVPPTTYPSMSTSTHSLSRHIPQPCPSHIALLPKAWPFLDAASSHPYTPVPSRRSALRPPGLQTGPNPMGSSIMPPVSPFSYPQTGAIPIQFPLPGSADRSQSLEVTLMSFEQDGPPARRRGREGWQ